MGWAICHSHSRDQGCLAVDQFISKLFHRSFTKLKFIETKLGGAFILEPERIDDDRGFFARTFCAEEFKAHGLAPIFVQCSISFNVKKGILRGMHYQAHPHQEEKLVRCTAGAIYDVIIDIRRDSPTFKQWISVELNSENRRLLYIPKGMAHGFQTLTDATEVFYQISEEYHPESARGLKWNDTSLKIKWPEGDRVILERDKSHPDFKL